VISDLISNENNDNKIFLQIIITTIKYYITFYKLQIKKVYKSYIQYQTLSESVRRVYKEGF